MNSNYFDALRESAKDEENGDISINPFSDEENEFTIPTNLTGMDTQAHTELTIIKRNKKEESQPTVPELEFNATPVSLEETMCTNIEHTHYKQLLQNILDKKMTVIVCDSFVGFKASDKIQFKDPFFITNSIEEAEKLKSTINNLSIIQLEEVAKKVSYTSSTKPRHIKGNPAAMLSGDEDEYTNIFMERFNYKHLEAHKAGIAIKERSDLQAACDATAKRLKEDPLKWIGDLIQLSKEGKSLRICSWFYSKKNAMEYGYESASEMPSYVSLIIDKINELS